MRRATLYRVEIPADLSREPGEDIFDQIHRFLTRAMTNVTRRVKIDAQLYRVMAKAHGITEHRTVNVVHMLLLAGILREIGAAYPYIVDDFYDAELATYDDLEGVELG